MTTCGDASFGQRLIVRSVFVTYVLAFNITVFTFDLYQHESYDPNQSETEIILRAIAHDINTSSNIITPNGPTTTLLERSAQYFITIHLGTPGIDINAVPDIRSAFTWTPCRPCINCISIRKRLFNPKDSSSHTKILCGPNNHCPPESNSRCGQDGFCHYIAHYSDGSYSSGTLSTDTLKMKSTVEDDVIEISNYIFGCGADNKMNFGVYGTPAIIGLGAGEQSLLTQLGPHSMQRFSYCLLPLGTRGKTGRIHFGTSEKVRGSGVITMPMVTKYSSHSYYVTLEAFTIGKIRIEFTGLSETVEEGNIVMDLSTHMIGLPRKFYTQIRQAVITQTILPPVADPHQLFDLCFMRDKALHLPNIVANFKGGDVSLSHSNTYVRVGSVECLAFYVNDNMAIYGTLAQQNWIVQYDRIRGTILFKPFECTDF